MANFYLDNKDITFLMQHLELDEVIELIENDFQDHGVSLLSSSIVFQYPRGFISILSGLTTTF